MFDCLLYVRLYNSGINLIFNLEIHENTTTDFEPGIRFVVHPRRVVAMPHDEGITIKGGERAIIGITQVINSGYR